MHTTSFARTLQMLMCTDSGLATHNTCTHTCKHKKHAYPHARKSSSPGLPSVLKVRFEGETSPALLSAPSSITLVFHKIIKARFVGF